MTRSIRLSILAVAAVGVLICSSTAWATHEWRLDVKPVREFDAPDGLPAKEALSAVHLDDGTTLVAGTSSTSPPSCIVVVARPETARAYPYRHSGDGTICLRAVPHPDRGFYLRGTGPGSDKGAPSGFTARIAPSGAESWRVSDAAIAEASTFEGRYRRPVGALAHSPETGYLMLFSYATLRVGDLGAETVTHATVIEGGDLLTPAEPLGEGVGFGPLGDLKTLPKSGKFLYRLARPDTPGAYLATFDGDRAVNEIDLASDDWEERHLLDVVPDRGDRLALLWQRDAAETPNSGITVVESTGERLWSRAYPSAVRMQPEDAERTEIGAPWAVRFAPARIVAVYGKDRKFVRAVDRQTGEVEVVADLTDAVPGEIVALLQGDERPVRVLTRTVDGETFREYRLGFVRREHVEADRADAATLDVGPDAGDMPTEGGGCPCATLPGGRPVLPVAPVAVLLVAGVARRLHRRFSH